MDPTSEWLQRKIQIGRRIEQFKVCSSTILHTYQAILVPCIFVHGTKIWIINFEIVCGLLKVHVEATKYDACYFNAHQKVLSTFENKSRTWNGFST